MKKRLLSILFLAFSLALSGCTNTTTQTEIDTNTTEPETIKIVATSFHEYDWLTQVIGDVDGFSITLLIDDGIDLHNYEPTVEDIANISSSDLFIYNGGESDSWVDDILASTTDLNTINVIEVLDDNVQMEVIVEGMEESDDHDHDDDDHDHDDDEDDDETHSHEDEHVWLSLENASIVCAHFADVLAQLDAANADIFEANAQAYISELNILDEAYETMIAESARDTIIVTDRFPFLYLFTDYGINYYAAFSGCSTETEASFETVIFLAQKAEEYDVNYLVIVENGLEALATTIASSTVSNDQEILVLNSMQSVTQSDIDAGVTYLSIMEDNLEILRLALSE